MNIKEEVLSQHTGLRKSKTHGLQDKRTKVFGR